MSIYNHCGINLYYEVRGSLNSKKVIVFLNGVMASTTSWENQVGIFEKMGYKIILHDFKGQLKSDKPEGPYTFDQHAEELKGLLEYLKVDKAHLIGTSYGSEVAMRTAILFPDIVESISVIDGLSEIDEVVRYFINAWRDLAKEKDGEKFFKGMAPSIYGNSYLKNKELIEARIEAFKSIPSDYYQGQIYLYDAFENDVYMTDRLKDIKCPALIIVGEEDLLKRLKFSRLLSEKIPNNEFVIIPDCGHVTIFEQPKVLNTLLLGFIIKNTK